MISLRRVRSIAFKEYKHILRDPFTLAVTLALPLVFVAFFGFVIDLDYKHMKVAVFDGDGTAQSRKFLRGLSSSEYFDLRALESIGAAQDALAKNNSPAALIIKKDFGRNIARGDAAKPARAQLMLDGSDNAKAGIVLSYMTLALQKAEAVFTGADFSPADIIRTRFLFNPELNSRWFIVPALNTIIIGFLAIVLTALTVAKEWENGSMELLLSTPVRPAEIVLGKLAPYFFLTFFDVLLVFVLALLVFKIPFLGSFILFLIACGVYIIGALALGLLISVLARAQQAAIQFAMAVGLLPSFIFSGFIFPIENMPLFFRWFTAAFPQRWYLTISRNLFLSEAGGAAPGGFSALWLPFLMIFLFAALMILLAVQNFKTDVEP